MNPEYKAKWIAALNSGQYKQTTERLCDSDGYCCLGVLANIVDPTAWRDSDDPDVEGFGVKTWNDLSSDLDSGEISDALDLSWENQNKLISLNDDERLSFREIADWIEANL
jgi:hypothetical protein